LKTGGSRLQMIYLSGFQTKKINYNAQLQRATFWNAPVRWLREDSGKLVGRQEQIHQR